MSGSAELLVYIYIGFSCCATGQPFSSFLLTQWDAAEFRNWKNEDEGKYGFIPEVRKYKKDKEGKQGNVHGAFTACYQAAEAAEDHSELMPREMQNNAGTVSDAGD